MKSLHYKLVFCILVYVCSIKTVCAQSSEKKPLKLGINYGASTQSSFPYNNPNYTYTNKYLKLQINRTLYKKNKFAFELNIEPSIYSCEHQLINKYYIQPEYGDDYLEQRQKYLQERQFTEYALNFGAITRFTIVKNLNTYALLSVGPLISDADTERLKKGFAFSDIFGIGISYKISSIQLDLRGTLRHTSNANLFWPNEGHNSIGIESGILFEL